MADRPLAVPRLGFLLAKIRDELRQFLDAFQCAISGKDNVNWRGFCLEVPDPGNGGTISFPAERPHINLSTFAIIRSNIPLSETDIDTAASCLEDFDLPHDAKRLRDEFQDLKDAFCSLGETNPKARASISSSSVSCSSPRARASLRSSFTDSNARRAEIRGTVLMSKVGGFG